MTPNVMYGAPFFREDTHGSGTHGSSIWDDEIVWDGAVGRFHKMGNEGK